MIIASWNVNSIRVRIDQVADWIKINKPNVLGLQETKTKDEDFPHEVFKELGYYSYANGQPAYNGVALITDKPLEDICAGMTAFHDDQKRFLSGLYNGIRIWNLYVPNGQSVGSDKYDYKLRWLDGLRQELELNQGSNYPNILMGDFNIVPKDEDVHDPSLWKDKILCSDPERKALKAITQDRLIDSFRHLNPDATNFSWWDYRWAGYRRNLGLRIDLILVADALMSQCTRSIIDETPRRLERPSDHAPIYIELEPTDHA
jgi:exodeoxyribonuclease III